LRASGVEVIDFGAASPTSTRLKDQGRSDPRARSGATKYTVEPRRSEATSPSSRASTAFLPAGRDDGELRGKHALFGVPGALRAGDEVLLPAPFWVSADMLILAEAKPLIVRPRVGGLAERGAARCGDRSRDARTC
jgi:hypothetical protein